jgi:hypothetical protein
MADKATTTVKPSIFTKSADLNLKNAKRLNLPDMVMQSQVPEGEALVGELLKVVDSTASTVNGKLLWLKLTSGQEILFPATGSVRGALAAGVDTKEAKAMQTAFEKHLGATITFKRNSPTGAGERTIPSFDVFVTPK